jgi:hypothetical protein
MNGGVLNVPDDEVQEFFQEYVSAVKSGVRLFAVEQKTENFKFFVDLDYTAPQKLEDDDLLKFCTIIHDSIETPSRCLIARAKPRQVSTKLIKTGVHIHWPDLVVTRTKALNLRTKIIMSLTRDCPFDWDKIIDASVYAGSGLRMLWSYKRNGGGALPYTPWCQLNSTLTFSDEPSVEILNLFSIRTSGDAPESETFENIEGLQGFIQKYLEGQDTTHVKKVQRHEHDGWFVQTDSTYCENIRRKHKSNHVWFTIRSGRISQRCFDDECREFKGREHILPPSIVEQLKDVAIVGSPSSCFLSDIFPDGTSSAIQKVRTDGPPLFGSGPSELEAIFGKPSSVRTVGFDPVR